MQESPHAFPIVQVWQQSSPPPHDVDNMHPVTRNTARL